MPGKLISKENTRNSYKIYGYRKIKSYRIQTQTHTQLMKLNFKHHYYRQRGTFGNYKLFENMYSLLFWGSVPQIQIWPNGCVVPSFLYPNWNFVYLHYQLLKYVKSPTIIVYFFLMNWAFIFKYKWNYLELNNNENTVIKTWMNEINCLEKIYSPKHILENKYTQKSEKSIS